MIAQLTGRGISMWISLYADDAVIFANPVKEAVDTSLHLLSSFGEAMGLKLNQAKSAVIPINYVDVQLTEVLQNFGGAAVHVPNHIPGTANLSKEAETGAFPIHNRPDPLKARWMEMKIDEHGR